MAEQPTEEEITAARHLFAGECRFVAGATTSGQLPEGELPEIAFAGISNVGKSSLVNALTGRKTLARTSSNPGHTRQLNFFRLRDSLVLVDLPGYGYAKASKKDIASWTGLTRDYLKGRKWLKRVCLLVDARRGLKESDRQVMEILNEAAVSYQIVLTKVDKVKKSDVEKIIYVIRTLAPSQTAMHPEVVATSSTKSYGIDFLRVMVAGFAISGKP